jgi:hypothetical protein
VSCDERGATWTATGPKLILPGDRSAAALAGVAQYAARFIPGPRDLIGKLQRGHGRPVRR